MARALGADPPVLLMDEPFGAIDRIARERLQNEFLRIQRAVKKTVVFVTHDIDEAIKLADRIAVMNQGRLEQYDTPAAILARPAVRLAFSADVHPWRVILEAPLCEFLPTRWRSPRSRPRAH